MGYDYINTTELADIPSEKVSEEVKKLMELRRVTKIEITHTKDYRYKIVCDNLEHGVTF